MKHQPNSSLKSIMVFSDLAQLKEKMKKFRQKGSIQGLLRSKAKKILPSDGRRWISFWNNSVSSCIGTQSATKLLRHCTQIGLLSSQNKITHIPSPPLNSKLRCLLFFTGSLNSGTTLHGEDDGWIWGGEGESFCHRLQVTKQFYNSTSQSKSE